MRPTARSLKLLREEGWLCQVVEQTIHAGPRIFKRDLFQIGDIICIKGESTLLVQTTSDSNYAARLHKILVCEHFDAIVRAGWHIELHGWAKKGSRGARKTWTVRRERVKPITFDAAEVVWDQSYGG